MSTAMILQRMRWATCTAVLLGMALLPAGNVQAQPALEVDPGYVDLREVEGWFAQAPIIEVNIREALLQLVAGASRADDPELADLLERLRAMQVRAYTIGPARYQVITRRAERFADRLADDGWDAILRVREPDEHIAVFVRPDDGGIAGLMVMVLAATGEDSVFINIVGDIDPEEIGRIGRKFNIDALNERVLSRDGRR